jgi:GNAT superfamily N-acetyltransferase
MRVRKIDTSRAQDVRQFVDFPFKLYRDSPQWVPPLVPDMKLALNRDEYPFYYHSTADFFVAEEGDRTLGRIAAIHNRRYNEYHRSNTAFFYFFDAIDNLGVARTLFDAAIEWALDRDLDEIIGPRGLLRGDGHGLLVEGFEHRPAMGIPYNYPYYASFLQELGFEKEIDFLSAHLKGDYDLPQRFYEVAEKVKERRGFWVKSFTTKRELRRWVPEVQKVNNEAFVDVWGYYPIDEAEANAVADRFLAAADPRLIKLVMKKEEVVGFIIGYPDVSAGIQRANGRLWPFGWLHILLDLKRTNWVNFNGAGLLPEHQGVGASVVLYTEIAKSVSEFNFDHADLVQVAETNIASMAEVNAVGGEWYKRHRIYRRQL